MLTINPEFAGIFDEYKVVKKHLEQSGAVCCFSLKVTFGLMGKWHADWCSKTHIGIDELQDFHPPGFCSFATSWGHAMWLLFDGLTMTDHDKIAIRFDMHQKWAPRKLHWMFLLPASLRTPGISLFFAIARSDMRCLDTPCYATACARTVRIMHGWGGGWGGGGGRGCMRCLVTHVGCYRTAHTCFMLRNCMCSYCSYHARMGWGVGWGGGLHALSCHTCWNLQNCTYMFHATQLHVLVLFVSCTDGVGGGGRGCMRCLVTHVGCYRTAHTCFMLRNMCSYCSYHARMGWGVGRGGGVGVVACVVLSHMLDATELHIHVSCYATACARTVRIMHGWGGGWGGGGVGVVACVVLSHMLDATELHIHVSCYATAFAHTCTHANSDFPRGALMASESLSELLHGTFFF